jgi:hypothetical protein
VTHPDLCAKLAEGGGGSLEFEDLREMTMSCQSPRSV